MRIKMRIFAGFLVSLLGGCLTIDVSPESAGPPPDLTKYRLVVRDYLRTSFIDPYSVRDAQIAKPKPGLVYIEGTIRHEPGWVVCVRANAKNRMGAYIGIRDTMVLLRGDRAVASFSSPDPGHYELRTVCGSEQYEPFPEFEVGR